jgi:hypothetical protein
MRFRAILELDVTGRVFHAVSGKCGGAVGSTGSYHGVLNLPLRFLLMPSQEEVGPDNGILTKFYDLFRRRIVISPLRRTPAVD